MQLSTKPSDNFFSPVVTVSVTVGEYSGLRLKEDFQKSEIELDHRFSNPDACYEYLA